jgi:hypothetical protein
MALSRGADATPLASARPRCELTEFLKLSKTRL